MAVAAVRVVGMGAEEEVAVAAGAVVRAVLGAGVIVAVVRVGITQVALHELDLVVLRVDDIPREGLRLASLGCATLYAARLSGVRPCGCIHTI